MHRLRSTSYATLSACTATASSGAIVKVGAGGTLSSARIQRSTVQLVGLSFPTARYALRCSCRPCCHDSIGSDIALSTLKAGPGFPCFLPGKRQPLPRSYLTQMQVAPRASTMMKIPNASGGTASGSGRPCTIAQLTCAGARHLRKVLF